MSICVHCYLTALSLSLTLSFWICARRYPCPCGGARGDRPTLHSFSSVFLLPVPISQSYFRSSAPSPLPSHLFGQPPPASPSPREIIDPYAFPSRLSTTSPLASSPVAGLPNCGAHRGLAGRDVGCARRVVQAVTYYVYHLLELNVCLGWPSWNILSY